LPAQYSLGIKLIKGKDIKQDINRGVFWLKKSADQGSYEAMRDLGYLYFAGIGLNKDYQQAIKLLTGAAEENYPFAQYLLGEIYRLGGYGIKQNTISAKYWYKKSSTNYEPSKQRLVVLEEDRKLDYSELIKEQIQIFKALPDDSYAIQLMVLKNFSSIYKVMSKYQSKDYYFLQFKKDGSILYMIIYGHYDSKEEALNKGKILEKQSQFKQIWIRKVKNIKKRLK